MIFNVAEHIDMIRNGLHYEKYRHYYHPSLIIKTQTRRINRSYYQVEPERKKAHEIGYAVQRKRGAKGEPDIRIVMDRIWEETPKYWCGSYYGFCISQEDAKAEGEYSPKEYEELFRELNPKWHGWGRWVFKFHVIEVQT